MTAIVRRLCLATLLIAPGCRHDAPAPRVEPGPPPTSTASIPLAAVTGKIGGKAFSVRAARYWVDRRPGYAKIDIELLAIVPEKACEDVSLKHPTSVWLRRTGTDQLVAETARFGPGLVSPWQAQYEQYEGRNWNGQGDAAALLSLAAPGHDLKLEGELAACFGDAERSCVAGQFVATYCPIRIDALVRGVEAMERPLAGSQPLAIAPPP